MPGKWDTSMKRLLGENPEHFIKWLLPGAELTGTVKLQPPNLNDREIEADNLCEASLNKKQCLVNFEFQSYRDDTKEVDRIWLKWRFKMLRDVLRDTWAYQEIMQEGRQERRQEQRLTLLEVVQSRFPGIEPLAKKTVDSISDLAVLRRLIVKMSVVETEDKAKQVLLEMSKDKKKK